MKINYYYAFFLVFVTPISIPIALYTVLNHSVSAHHIWTAFAMYCITGLGITVGYHRYLSHRAFQANPTMKLILLIMGAMAMQGSPASWASVHIQHHAHSDRKQDPHSPHSKGFWYAHTGWLFNHFTPNLKKYGKWLTQDKQVMHVSRNYFYYSLLGLIIPFVLGGWVGLIWGGLLRLCICCHLTWGINSICHLWGKRDYLDTNDLSRNNLLLSLFTFGEGWHNNHHRFMQLANFGHKWYQIDFGQWFVLALKQMGLIHNVKLKRDFSKPLRKIEGVQSPKQ